MSSAIGRIYECQGHLLYFSKIWKASAAYFMNVGFFFYTPPHFVAGYYVIPFGVCPSFRAHHFRLSIYSRNFFKFYIHIVIGDEWYGIVNGRNPSIFNRVTALFRIGKMVSGLFFLYCS